MSEIKPVVYLFHGDDTMAIQRGLEGMVARMGDPTMAELNVSRLDGQQNREEDLRAAVNTLPFLTERRLVVLTHPLARLTSEPARERFREMLDSLPESTALVLVLEDSYERNDWRTLRQKHWLRRWMETAGKRAYYQLFQLPTLSRMVEWIRREASERGGQFSLEASTALVEQVGNDTRAASLEVEKLLAYVDCRREVEAQDVAELTAQGGQADVFQMVDAMAAGNAQLALNLLHRLLEEEDDLNLFGMVIRQFRLLLVGREMLDEGLGPAAFAKGLAHNSFVAQKTMEQARRFSLQRLEEIYHRLLAIDEQVKTSQTSLSVALDVLVAEMAR
jgi:DNA polymerase-3 subunit delta